MSSDRISALEIRLQEGEDVSSAKKEIRQLLGPGFLVQDRYEQQEDVFRIMRVEKLISYLFLTFILLVACFNIIGSLSMLMIDKKADVQTKNYKHRNSSIEISDLISSVQIMFHTTRLFD